ncbi:MAG: glycosyltransferase family 39 protein [Flavobacteriales bacterium]|nr:glycosyltransferase family 39 protein [Flavobacteriales bacterium]
MKWKHLCIALLLAAINFGVKFSFLDDSSFNLDEAYSVYYAQQDIPELSKIFEKEANPPTHFLLLHYWMDWFGISEIGTRSLSLLFSSLVMALIYLIFKSRLKLFETLIIVVGFGFCDPLFFYGNEIRVHAISAFAGVLSLFFLLNAVKRPNIKNLFLHGFSLTLLVYLHYANSILIAVEGIIILSFIFKRAHIRFLWIYILIILSIIPVAFWISGAKISSTSSWLTVPTLDSIWPMWVKLSNGIPWIGIIFLTIICLGILMVKGLTNKLIIAMPIFYLLLAFGISQYIPLFLERYLLIGALLILFSAAYSISFITSKTVRPILLIGSVLLLGFSFTSKTEKGEDWRGVNNYIKKYHAHAHVLVTPVFMYRPYLYYADQDEFITAGDILPRCFKKNTYFIDLFGPELFDYIHPKELIYVSKNPNDLQNLLALHELFIFQEERWFEGLHLIVYQSRTP